MITELNLTLTLSDDSVKTSTAHIAPETDKEGNRIYRADLPIFYDNDGNVLFVKTCNADVIPAHSVLVLAMDAGEDDD